MKIAENLKYWYIKIPSYIAFLFFILYFDWKLYQTMIIISLYILINSLIKKTFQIKNYLKSLLIISLMIGSIMLINKQLSPAISIILVHIIGISIIIYSNKKIIETAWDDVKKSLDPIKQKKKEEQCEKEKKLLIKESVAVVENIKTKAK